MYIHLANDLTKSEFVKERQNITEKNANKIASLNPSDGIVVYDNPIKDEIATKMNNTTCFDSIIFPTKNVIATNPTTIPYKKVSALNGSLN